jgi:nucleotide-binding universal stress UspA family protein
LRVRPHELVGEGLDADLLVLGGPRHRIPARVGLVGCSAVQHAPCPVLLAARPG